ncbi:hypothetical protein ACGFYA_22270 [Streptomyces sp. NPDC048305]|uniref:hypothetical protein n=1 Tax=Streptomyces sp. NPDC048305 TaxID=3365532 RepID=UPI003724457B
MRSLGGPVRHRTTQASRPIPGETVTPRTPPLISKQIKPRLATALFRRYLRACLPTGPDRPSPLAGARPESALAETQRVGHRHHH